jgi:DNA-binding MarR family transcriptional regulator
MSDLSQQELIQACMQDLRRIVKALESYSLMVEKRYNLTGPQLWALWEIGQHGPCALKDLAARMRLDPSTVVGVVDRLAGKGLLVRNPDPKDRRKVSLMTTPAGGELVKSAPHPAQGHLLAGLETLDRAQVDSLHTSLKTLVNVLKADDLDVPFFCAKD